MDGSLLVSIKNSTIIQEMKKLIIMCHAVEEESSSPKCTSGSGYYLQRWTLHIPWSRFTKQP